MQTSYKKINCLCEFSKFLCEYIENFLFTTSLIYYKNINMLYNIHNIITTDVNKDVSLLQK
uniref:Uncharacterized protein n=1 Tax=Myoviridae sp. ctXwe21 TaxID=2825123 RepID=A0A8S5PZW0_9CAUD|nr:MAG TPA: hypothetical protein [Myoviridae sp. ctXwe21]